jgi:hypothetical protein
MLLDIEQNIADLEKSFKHKHNWMPNYDKINDKEIQPLLNKQEDSGSSLESTPKKK